MLIHGRLGGGYTPAPDPGAPGIDPLVTRVYMVDYNGNGENALPMRVFEQRADGSVNPTPVYTGPMSNGTNFTIHSVAEFVYQALAALPIDGDLLIVGHSQGGFVTKDLIYHHYDDLRIAGHPIVKVVFLGHPHYGIVADPSVYLPFVCSPSLIGYMPPTPPRLPQENAQDCATARWMLGWRNASAASLVLTPDRLPSFDNRDLPQIEWLSVSGNTGLGTTLKFPFFEEITGVDPNTVLGDGLVPTLSSEGVDEFGFFPELGDLQFDRVLSALANHGYTDLAESLLAVAPDAFAGVVECGDLDGDAERGRRRSRPAAPGPGRTPHAHARRGRLLLGRRGRGLRPPRRRRPRPLAGGAGARRAGVHGRGETTRRRGLPPGHDRARGLAGRLG